MKRIIVSETAHQRLELFINKISGIFQTTIGMIDGKTPNIELGDLGEERLAIEVFYDETKLSYKAFIEKLHDYTTMYSDTSIILFYRTDKEKIALENILQELNFPAIIHQEQNFHVAMMDLQSHFL